MSKGLLFELIQVSIGGRDNLNKVPTEEEWQYLYEEAIRQSLVGFLFYGVERLYNYTPDYKPPMKVFLEWIGKVSHIEQLNKSLNYAAAQLTRLFKNGGLCSCVLKGQGLAALYPDPLRRQPGDIDLWVEGCREHTLKFLKRCFYKTGNVVIHHVEAHIIESVESEIHFIPMWMYNPIHNHQLQMFWREEKDRQFSHFDDKLGFSYPTLNFNGVYLLTHIFHHFLDEGVGLRQVIDYYYVVKQLTSIERKTVIETIEKIGCRKFAEAMMYVLGEVCGLDRSLMICEPNSNRGEKLLSEILQTGNFGQYDERFEKTENETVYSANKRKLIRWRQLVKDYPSEVLSIPGWKLWHWCWRKYHGYV